MRNPNVWRQFAAMMILFLGCVYCGCVTATPDRQAADYAQTHPAREANTMDLVLRRSVIPEFFSQPPLASFDLQSALAPEDNTACLLGLVHSHHGVVDGATYYEIFKRVRPGRCDEMRLFLDAENGHFSLLRSALDGQVALVPLRYSTPICGVPFSTQFAWISGTGRTLNAATGFVLLLSPQHLARGFIYGRNEIETQWRSLRFYQSRTECEALVGE